jgi:hypothetical protein
MDDRELLLIMTVVRLINGSTPKPIAVRTAYDAAVRALESERRGPVQAR